MNGSRYNNEEISRLGFVGNVFITNVANIIPFQIRGCNLCRRTVAQTRVKGRKTSSKIWNKLNEWILKPHRSLMISSEFICIPSQIRFALSTLEYFLIKTFFENSQQDPDGEIENSGKIMGKAGFYRRDPTGNSQKIF